MPPQRVFLRWESWSGHGTLMLHGGKKNVNIPEYRQAVVLGFRSILGAATDWRENPLTTEVNRRMWGPWPWLTLAVLTIAGLGLHRVMPPFTDLIGFVPPLMSLAYIPGSIRDLLYSVPAIFAFVVVWRVHQLRSTSNDEWPDRSTVPRFGARFFDASALPVAIATLVLAVGIESLGLIATTPAGPESVEAVSEGLSLPVLSFSCNRVARSLVIVALVAGILGVHRTIGKGLGKLIGAGFFVWGIHLGISYSVPWMVSWWTYLPYIGQFAPQRSAGAVHLLFDLAIALTAWTAAREKCREAPLWCDEPPPPPPPPPTEADRQQNR